MSRFAFSLSQHLAVILFIFYLLGSAALAANVGFLVGDAFFSCDISLKTRQHLEAELKSNVDSSEIVLLHERNVIRCSLPKGTIDLGGFIGAGAIRVYGLSRDDCKLLMQLPPECFRDGDESPGYRALVYNSDFNGNRYHYFCLYNEKWRPDVLSTDDDDAALQKLFRKSVRYEPFIGDYRVASEDISMAEYVDGLQIDPPSMEDLIAIHTHSGGPLKVRVSIPLSRSQIVFCERGGELKIWSHDESAKFYVFRSGSLQLMCFTDGMLRVLSDVKAGMQ